MGLLTRTEGFVNLVNMNDSSSSDLRCPSNGRSASSTSGLLAPAAQTSAGRASCSCLPWLAVMPQRPHRPLLLPPLATPSLYSPAPHVILRRQQPHTAAEPVNPRTPLRVGIHCLVFPGSVSSLPRPRRRPPPWCSRRGVVNVAKERLPSEEYCTWRG